MLSWNQKYQTRECCAVVKSIYWNSLKENKRTEVEDMDEMKTKFVLPSCMPLQIDSFFSLITALEGRVFSLFNPNH